MNSEKINTLDPDGKLILTGSEKPWQDVVAGNSKISATLALRWKSENATHTDIQFLDNLNLRHDYFPPEIEMQLGGRHRGDIIEHTFAANALFPDYETRQHTVKPEQFNRDFRRGMVIEPRLGRFYPKGIFNGVQNVLASSMQPCRITDINETQISTDFSHPLANKPVELTMQIQHIWEIGSERGGRCSDITQLMTENGPGMQARYGSIATDFFSDQPFDRIDADDDAVFYQKLRMVQHLDSSCRAQIRQLYAELLPARGQILDLMASWDSHLPETLQAQVTGLGMNASELDANPVLSTCVVHDLNRDPSLPFADNSFDAIVCTASFEYLTQPDKIVSALAAVLKPGGLLVITFSNRWFPTKAVKIWSEIHEFERIGLVSETLQRNADFSELHTLSSRGLLRPQDDKYASELLLSDPVYALWATRR